MSAGKIARWVGGVFVAFMGLGVVGTIVSPQAQLTSTSSSPTAKPAVLGEQTAASPTTTPTVAPTVTPTPNIPTPTPLSVASKVQTKITPKPTVKPSPRPTIKPVAPASKSNCDPNYSGACVPNVYPSDVDCAGGTGDGPYYVRGPVTVIGTDRYGLDSPKDADKIGCE